MYQCIIPRKLGIFLNNYLNICKKKSKYSIIKRNEFKKKMIFNKRIQKMTIRLRYNGNQP